jgi:general secretion pathway protein F
MPTFRYHAVDTSGKLISGDMAAAAAAEVAQKIEQLGLVLVDSVTLESGGPSFNFQSLFNKPRAQDVTIFTRDLALLLRAGARINDALEILADDKESGRLRSVVNSIRSGVMSGESFADALLKHEQLFPPMYVALIRVGEASGSLDQVLEVLAQERARAESVRQKLSSAMRYPLFVLAAAGSVLLFFLGFVLPQFASVLKDFGAKVDQTLLIFLNLSTLMRDNADTLLAGTATLIALVWLTLRRAEVRKRITDLLVRLPGIRTMIDYHRAALFCRNLGVLLSSGVHLTTTLNILIGMMAGTGSTTRWTDVADRVRHGAKLSDALMSTEALPSMAIRMLRLGDETGQLPLLAGRVAEFYEAKLQRALDRVVGIAGPAAVVAISLVVGGLIVSVMTALMSVSQIVG